MAGCVWLGVQLIVQMNPKFESISLKELELDLVFKSEWVPSGNIHPAPSEASFAI